MSLARTPFLLSMALLSMALVTSCASSSAGGGSPSVTQNIGPEGGTIVVDGATVTFPKGALASEKAITIASTDRVPEGFVAVSKVFECGPSGTDFAQPVTMQMPFVDDGKGALTMFWSSGADPSFKDVGGKVDGKTMSATVMHFSSGFVGRKK